MRRLVTLAAVTLLASLLSGCDNASTSADNTPTSHDASQPQRRLRIAVSIPSADHGWTAGVGWWAERATKLYPDVDFTISKAANAADQVTKLEDLMIREMDGFVILAYDSEQLTPIAKRIRQAGHFIVNVDRGFTEPVADIFLEGDNKAFGRKSAQYIVERMGGKGNLVILEGIKGVTVNEDRVSAAMEVFAQHPDIKILASQPADWQQQKGLNIMQDYLTRFPKIDAVWAQDDDIALGVIRAIREAGRESEMWVLGGAGMKDVVKMVMDGSRLIPADITYPPSMIAVGIHLCVSTLERGRKDGVMQFMPRHLMLDVELITPENAERFYFPESVY